MRVWQSLSPVSRFCLVTLFAILVFLGLIHFMLPTRVCGAFDFAVSGDGSVVAFGNHGGELGVIRRGPNGTGGETLRTGLLPYVRRVRLSHDGRRVLCSDQYSASLILDLESSRVLQLNMRKKWLDFLDVCGSHVAADSPMPTLIDVSMDGEPAVSCDEVPWVRFGNEGVFVRWPSGRKWKIKSSTALRDGYFTDTWSKCIAIDENGHVLRASSPDWRFEIACTNRVSDRPMCVRGTVNTAVAVYESELLLIELTTDRVTRTQTGILAGKCEASGDGTCILLGEDHIVMRWFDIWILRDGRFELEQRVVPARFPGMSDWTGLEQFFGKTSQGSSGWSAEGVPKSRG